MKKNVIAFIFAASRHSIGTGVIGGMLAATFIAPFFVPVFFRWVAAWGRGRSPAAMRQTGVST